MRGELPDIDNAICPICKKQRASIAARPFCSTRCADIDLYRWMSGQYSVPVLLSEPTDDDMSRPQESDFTDNDHAILIENLPDGFGGNTGGGVLH